MFNYEKILNKKILINIVNGDQLIQLLSPSCTVTGTHCSNIIKNLTVMQSQFRENVGVLKIYDTHRNHHLFQLCAFCNYVEHISYGKVSCIMCTLGLSV